MCGCECECEWCECARECECVSVSVRVRVCECVLQIRLCRQEKPLVAEASECAEWFDSDAELDTKANQLVELLKKSQHCVLFSGAGMS